MIYLSYTLSLSFTPTLQTIEGLRLVTEGIYRWIRHPMYTSFTLSFTASFLTSTSWVVGALGFVYSLLILNRANAEEKMLLESLGDEYQAYMKHSGRFLPKMTNR